VILLDYLQALDIVETEEWHLRLMTKEMAKKE
jgi:hypothetical protein